MDLYFFLEKDAKPASLPEIVKPVVLEQVAAAKNPPVLEDWEDIGLFWEVRERLRKMR